MSEDGISCESKIIKMRSITNRILLIQGDITKLKVDAIVNAANTWLMGGGGVDGAIHRAGGPVILAECREIVARQGRCETGQAVITSGGNLSVRFVIHTVGPVWHGGNSNEAELLANAYLNSLKLAIENGIETIAFPNISTGVYGFPKEKAVEIAIETVTKFLSEEKQIIQVTFVCFDQENYELYQRILNA
jgi:O-acetyl-ADP-ribose deacetylase (regulator of RNase III)